MVGIPTEVQRALGVLQFHADSCGISIQRVAHERATFWLNAGDAYVWELACALVLGDISPEVVVRKYQQYTSLLLGIDETVEQLLPEPY